MTRTRTRLSRERVRRTLTTTQYRQHATTTAVSEPAGPDGPGDETDHLRLGRYVIVEQVPVSEPEPPAASPAG